MTALAVDPMAAALVEVLTTALNGLRASYLNSPISSSVKTAKKLKKPGVDDAVLPAYVKWKFSNGEGKHDSHEIIKSSKGKKRRSKGDTTVPITNGHVTAAEDTKVDKPIVEVSAPLPVSKMYGLVEESVAQDAIR
jgi:hypothetical protein